LKIKLDSAVLADSIKSLLRLVQAQTVSFEIKKGQFYITGTGNGNSCMLTVPCEIEDKNGTASFSIDANVFLQAVSKRKEVELTISDSNVLVKAARYEAELLVHQFEALEVVPKEVREEKSLRLKSKFLTALQANLPKVELKPLLAMYDYVPLGIKCTSEGTFVACFDDFQAAFFSDKELTGKVEFTIPSNIFSLIAKEIKNQDYSMAVTDAVIYAYNDMFELALARPQTEGDQVTLDQMNTLYSELKKRKDFIKLSIKTEGIRSLLENGRSVYEKDSTFTFKTKGKNCQLHLKSSFGQVKGAVMLDEEPSEPVEFTCDFNFFATLLEKAPATLELRVGKDMILFSNKPVTYLLSLV
jgi:hypothetical protein